MHYRIMAGMALTAVIAAPASAADLAVRPAAVAAPAAIWTGVYAGVNLGGDWADSGPIRRGVLGGGQIGYNWQHGNLVLGAETDIQGAGMQRSQVLTSAIASAITSNQSVDYLGTVRGRIGLASGNWLAYASGGLAYTTINRDGAGIVGVTGSYSGSNTDIGYAVGAGLEWAFLERWSAKAEYLHSEFSGDTVTYPTTAPAITIHYNPLKMNIARIGVNYRFGP